MTTGSYGRFSLHVIVQFSFSSVAWFLPASSHSRDHNSAVFLPLHVVVWYCISFTRDCLSLAVCICGNEVV